MLRVFAGSAYLRCTKSSLHSVRPRVWHDPKGNIEVSCLLRHYSRKRTAVPASLTGRIESQARRDQRLQREAEARERAAQPFIRVTPIRVLFLSTIGVIGYAIYNWQTDPSRSLILNPSFFTPFMLTSVDPHSPTCSIFNLLSVPAGQNTSNVSDAWRQGVWSVQVMQPDLQIARSYTPLPPSFVDSATEDHQLVRLFVRREDRGEISSFLHRLSPGTLVHMRGPHIEYKVPEDLDEILFLAGGTGIAPALQVAYSLYQARADKTSKPPTMRILWANRKRADSKAGLEGEDVRIFRTSLAERIKGAVTFSRGVPQITKSLEEVKVDNAKVTQQTQLVEEIDALVKFGNGAIKVEYFVDEEDTFITERIVQSCLSEAQSSGRASQKKKLILVSGPEGFVEHLAGPKQWSGGREVPGPLGGILSRMDLRGWDTWKL